MGSQFRPLAAVAPQQPLPPSFMRRAAWPYFSRTTSFISLLGMTLLLFADLNDGSGVDRIVPGAALGVQKTQQFLQSLRVGDVAQERALALHPNQVLALQFVEVV